MHDIGVVVSKRAPIAPEQLALAKETTFIARDRPITRAQPSVWTSPSGRIAVLRWGSYPAAGLKASNAIVVRGDHALTFSGALYHPAFERAEELLDLLIKTDDTAAVFSKVGGTGVIVYCDGARGVVRAARTVAGPACLFFADSDEKFVASTRSLFAGCVSQGTRRPRYDLDSLAAFVIAGSFTNKATAFSGVIHAPTHSQITVNQNGGVTISRLSDDFDQYGLEIRDPSPRDYDELTETLLRGARRLAPPTGRSRIGVSGGKDSRLLLAVLHRAGVDVLPFFGSNHADHPDLIVGQKLVTALGIPFEPPTILKADNQDDVEYWETRVDSFLQSEIVSYDARYSSRLGHPYAGAPFCFNHFESEPEYTLDWVGTGGEMLKGGLTMPDFLGTFDPPVEQTTDVARRNLVGDISFLSPRLQQTAQQRWEEVWQRVYRRELPLAALDRYYLDPFQDRGGSFMARSGAMYLYADTLLLRLIGRLSVRSRQANLPHVEAIRRLMPEMMDTPLAIQRWCFELNGPIPGDEAGYERRTPVQFERVSAARNQVGFTNTNIELKPVFMEGLRECERVLGDRLDFKRIWQIATTPAALEHRTSSLFWAMRTVHLLQSNRWLRDTEPERDPVRRVRINLPWDRIYLGLLTRYGAEGEHLLEEFGGAEWPRVTAGFPNGRSELAAEPSQAFDWAAGAGARPPRFLIDDEGVTASLQHRVAGAELLIEAHLDGPRSRTAWIAVPLFNVAGIGAATYQLTIAATSDTPQRHSCDVSLYTLIRTRRVLLEYPFASSTSGIDNSIRFTIPPAQLGARVELLLAMEPQVSRLVCRLTSPQIGEAGGIADLRDRCVALAAWFRNLLQWVAAEYGADPWQVAAEIDRVSALEPVWTEGAIPERQPGFSATQLLAFDDSRFAELLLLVRQRRLTKAADVAALILQPIHSLARYLAIEITREPSPRRLVPHRVIRMARFMAGRLAPARHH